jgi:Mn2+/Fe2+ NRAMP family transporter
MHAGDHLQPGNTNMSELTEEIKQHYTKEARCEVFTALTMAIIVFWNMICCSVVNVYKTTSHHKTKIFLIRTKTSSEGFIPILLNVTVK